MSRAGGARAGAGRPPIHGDRLVQVVVMVPAAVSDAARRDAAERGVTVSAVLRDALIHAFSDAPI